MANTLGFSKHLSVSRNQSDRTLVNPSKWRNHLPFPISASPGPATTPRAYIPNSSIPLQPLSPSSTVVPGTATAKSPPGGEAPWKDQGYTAFSEWMASEDDFFLFRRFESLNAHTILWMQDQIMMIEERLEKIHETVEKAPLHSSDPSKTMRNSSSRWDAANLPERHALMGELSRLLLHYNQYVEAYSKIRSRPLAEARQINNVQNWLARDAIKAEEAAFISHTGDLISINARTRPPLGRWLESFKGLHVARLFPAKLIPGLHQNSEYTIYSSNSTFEKFTNISVILVGLIMLLSPMWWLEFVNTSVSRLGIITGFICVFIAMMSVATVNKPFEVVAATAAYAAVLMVFMQIGGGKS